MSDLTLNSTTFPITNISTISHSPFEEARSENGSTSQTYYDDSQQYEFNTSSMLVSSSAFTNLRLTLDTLGGADSFKWAVGGYKDSLGNRLVPYTGNVSGTLVTQPYKNWVSGITYALNDVVVTHESGVSKYWQSNITTSSTTVAPTTGSHVGWDAFTVSSPYTAGSSSTRTYNAGSSVIEFNTDSTVSTSSGSLSRGDFICFPSVHPKLHQVTSIDTGTNTISIFPSLRKDIPGNTTIVYGDSLSATVKVSGERNVWDTSADTPTLTEISLTLVENAF